MGVASIDTGGTFTDLVYMHGDGRVERLKVPSDPDMPQRAVLTALEQLSREAPYAVVDEVRHGSTVATNALLERRGARTAFVTTEGFEDLLHLRRQNRPVLYALHPSLPPPLAARSIGVPERLDAHGGVLIAFDSPGQWIDRHRETLEGCESIAVCLLHAYANPAHERALARALRERFPATPVTISSELIPLHREYERASTVTVNAYVAPVMSRYLGSLADALGETSLAIMGSSGGLIPVARATEEPVHTVLSGPAGGVRGALAAGLRADRTRLLTLDMGGTSTDVSLVTGQLVPDESSAIDEHPLRVPILPIETVGAGGGSIAFVDEGGALRVGPRSAGALPGPACYGRGGQEPTVTDANVVLGRIRALLGGETELDVDAAHAAVSRIARELGASTEDTAHAIVAIAEANMARACKRVSMARGLDPRALTLVAFGGAGGLHACELADALGCRDVLFPREPGVLSAEGIGSAPREASVSRSVLRPLEQLSCATLEQAARDARTRLGADAAPVRLFVDLRYRGQSYTLPVETTPEALDGDFHGKLAEAFRTLHEQRYGYRLEEARLIEVSAVRAFADRHDEAVANETASPTGREERGPCTVATYGATLWVPEGWCARELESGDWRVERRDRARTFSEATSDAEPLALEIHRQRLAAIAEEMGSALMRSAFSANIKERRDFSCAVFDENGEMLAQAAHIPVHLGSQPLSVKAAIERVLMEPGQSVVLNAPHAGGTHLPDVTLVTPVFIGDGDAPAFYVSNRAHHADVGGVSPGSMPAPKRSDGSVRPLTLEDEGFVIEPQPLTEALRRAFADASRTPEERYGDLRAQEAADHVGAKRIRELASEVPNVRSLNRSVLDYGERRMRAILRDLPDGTYRFEDVLEDDGLSAAPITLRLTLTVRGDEATFDFRGSDDQTNGAMNAVRAIVESAVFYALRCLGDGTLPSNGGLMRPIEVLTREGSIVDARPPAAVSAGNVETSQRLVDVVFGALAQAAPDRIPAASGGTMNNVLFGGENEDGTPFVHYETLASGSGGGPSGEGASAIQCHMTNTLNTPIEDLEQVYPVRIMRYAVRKRESDANDPHRGGAGVERHYRFLAPAEVTLITERRKRGPYGLGGGTDGPCGVNRVIRANGTEERLGSKDSLRVEAGDTVIVETPGGGSWRSSAD